VHNCPFPFLTLRFMGPLNSCGPWSGASTAPPLVGLSRNANLTLLRMVGPGSPPGVGWHRHFC